LLRRRPGGEQVQQRGVQVVATPCRGQGWLDGFVRAGELPTMPSAKNTSADNARFTTTRVDSRRRVVMPATLPPDAVVSIQQLADDCWVVRRVRPSRKSRMVAVPII